MRLLLVGAFPYPHHQGSQIYFQEQALALRTAGAEIELLTYASGLEPAAHSRALDGFVHHTPPAWTAPRGLGAGPALGKPLADLALAMTLRQRLASYCGHDAYDAILTHNAEALIAASAGRLGLANEAPPIVYCVHTLLGSELSTYFKFSKKKAFSSHPEKRSTFRRGIDALGRGIDRQLARRADAWIALTHSSHRVMRQSSTRPGQQIAPPIRDPRLDSQRLDPGKTAQRFGLEPGGFFLYSGNLDGYQELEILASTAELLAQTIADPKERPVLVVASHDPEGEHRIAQMPGVEFRHVSRANEMQALLASAQANLLMRLAEGGYPIKLANAHSLGVPSIVFHAREWGLRDGVNALVATPDRPAASLAGLILRLAGNAGLAARLGAGARRVYESEHQPDKVANRTLALIEQVISLRDPFASSNSPTRRPQSAR